MPPTLEALGIDRLSFEDRLRLVQQIWDSIAEEAERAPISDEVRQMLEERVAEDDADPDGGIPWDQVVAEARARWGK